MKSIWVTGSRITSRYIRKGEEVQFTERIAIGGGRGYRVVQIQFRILMMDSIDTKAESGAVPLPLYSQ